MASSVNKSDLLRVCANIYARGVGNFDTDEYAAALFLIAKKPHTNNNGVLDEVECNVLVTLFTKVEQNIMLSFLLRRSHTHLEKQNKQSKKMI